MMNKILKKINGLFVTLSLTTMVFSPVAMGRQAQAEAEKLTQAQLEEFVQEFGLNKSQSVGEFYGKNKEKLPPRIQKMIEPLMTQYKNEVMPQFEVGQAKNSKGETIATLRITGKDQLANIQFLGEKDKFVKFDNTNLTLEDVANFDDMFAKLYFGDASHRKGMGDALTSPKNLKKQKVTTDAKVSPAKFVGLPKITREMWKKMSPMDRAQFMMNMRMLATGAQDVLDASSKSKKGKKTSSLEASPLNKWNNFFAMIDEANAVQEGGLCVVAGYIGKYKNKRCGYPESAKAACNYPCNPTLYGYDANGKQFCLASASELQTATHYNKGCDAKMPLSSVKLSLPAPAAKRDAARYQDIIDRNKAEALKDPAIIENTKKYLESMLRAKDPEYLEAFKNGNLSPTLLAKLKGYQDDFDGIIKVSRSQCAAAAGETQYDREFWGACDQLHARFLFVAAYLDKHPGCTTGETAVDPENLTCACPNGPAVAPGAQCASTPVVTPGGEPASGTPVVDSDSGQCDPQCTGVEKCVKTATDSDGVEVWECKAPGDGGKPDKKGGFWSKLWGGIKKVGPWVIGGVGLWLLYSKFLKPKKPKLNPAADMCPNGNIPPCGQVCTAPQALLSSGGCGCASCPPGQTTTNASSCLCETTSTTTTIFVCADGITQVSNLENCPSTPSYSCWDGSTVANPINCPEQPSTGTSTKPADSSR